MVDTSLNGDRVVDVILPESVALAAPDFRRMPSPGTMRDLRAQTGRTFEQMCGPEADPADLFQTQIWVKLRREFPGLRWDACADVCPEITEDDLAALDPTKLAAFGVSPPSADSGD
jgi:hypothetical protein